MIGQAMLGLRHGLQLHYDNILEVSTPVLSQNWDKWSMEPHIVRYTVTPPPWPLIKRLLPQALPEQLHVKQRNLNKYYNLHHIKKGSTLHTHTHTHTHARTHAHTQTHSDTHKCTWTHRHTYTPRHPCPSCAADPASPPSCWLTCCCGAASWLEV